MRRISAVPSAHWSPSTCVQTSRRTVRSSSSTAVISLSTTNGSLGVARPLLRQPSSVSSPLFPTQSRRNCCTTAPCICAWTRASGVSLSFLCVLWIVVNSMGVPGDGAVPEQLRTGELFFEGRKSVADGQSVELSHWRSPRITVSSQQRTHSSSSTKKSMSFWINVILPVELSF